MTQSPPVPLSTLLPRGANQAIRNASAKTFEFYSVLRQKPDVLASRGCTGGWIVMPEATELSVSMIESSSAFLPHCKSSDLSDSLWALSMWTI